MNGAHSVFCSDPVFYSTCLKRQPSADIAFEVPQCGAQCQLPEQTKCPSGGTATSVLLAVPC